MWRNLWQFLIWWKRLPCCRRMQQFIRNWKTTKKQRSRRKNWSRNRAGWKVMYWDFMRGWRMRNPCRKAWKLLRSKQKKFCGQLRDRTVWPNWISGRCSMSIGESGSDVRFPGNQDTRFRWSWRAVIRLWIWQCAGGREQHRLRFR